MVVLRIIVWFRNDLRVADNPVLSTAATHTGEKVVVPFYCFDPRTYGTTPWGSPKTGAHRAKFVLESVIDLRRSLRALGSDLVVGVGRPEELLPQLAAALGGSGEDSSKLVLWDDGYMGKPLTLLWQEQVAGEELAVDDAVRSAMPQDTSFRVIWSGTLYDLVDLPFEVPFRSEAVAGAPSRFRADLSRMYDVFTPFLRAIESYSEWHPPLPVPAKQSLPPPGDGVWKKLGDQLPADVRMGVDLLPALDELSVEVGAASVKQPRPSAPVTIHSQDEFLQAHLESREFRRESSASPATG